MKQSSDEMSKGAPEKVRLVPDEWHLQHIGRLADGRLFLAAVQLDPAPGGTRDFICTFLFDADGKFASATIDELGQRGAYHEQLGHDTFARHLEALGKYTIEEIWIRPFEVTSHGAVFGFVADFDNESGWQVVFMPGNTLCFWPPWDSGEYDT